VLEVRVQACRQISQANPRDHMLRRDGEGGNTRKAADSALPRKASSQDEGDRTANRHR
jgi:hypothetical protein